MESADLNWRKASYSSNGGAECIEVANYNNRMFVRDSEDKCGLMLSFGPQAWIAFLRNVKISK